jgi:8-oxo-dGTP pyrophosphatase MutT (NUDIX family)
MFHLFINNSVVTIRNERERKYGFLRPFDVVTTIRVTPQTALFKQVIALEPGSQRHCLEFITDKPEEAISELISAYPLVEAAGGVVLNNEERLLMIYRKNRWDLPKGKCEPGEDVADAAMREVEEETGVRNLEITGTLPAIYHSFRDNGRRTLKRTHWFAMRTQWNNPLQPQAEEGILDAKWIDRSDLHQYLSRTYPSVAELLNQHGLLSEETRQHYERRSW